MNNECKLLDIMYCLEYDLDQCKVCDPSHPVYKDQQCQSPYPTENNCVAYQYVQDRWVCMECVDLYYPSAYNVCSPITQQIENCQAYSTNSICKKCRPGYFYDKKNIKCVMSNDYEPNCQVFEERTSCSVCSFGYYLAEGECRECPNKANCDFCDPEDPQKCLACKDGFHINVSNQCE